MGDARATAQQMLEDAYLAGARTFDLGLQERLGPDFDTLARRGFQHWLHPEEAHHG
jgi:hypothetical protein